jgi:hypothetical protein
MSAVVEPSQKPPRTKPPAARPSGVELDLKASAYERAASWIWALLIVVGLTVLLLFLVWLTWRLSKIRVSVPIEIVEEESGRGDHAPGVARDPLPPGAEEIEELTEPQVEQTVQAVTDAVSSIAGTISITNPGAQVTGKGGGLGDSRRAGPLGDGPDTIPRSERWKFQYPGVTSRQYAAILDHFKIELGALGGGGETVDYAFNVSKPTPDRRSGKSEDEKRLLFIWTAGELQQADRELLSKASVPVSGRIIAQFIPAETEKELARVEFLHANRPAKDIRRTYFGVRPKGGGFEFYVIKQEYRR